MPGFLANLRDICLFRRGPEDMPYAPPLLIALLVACGVLQAGFSLHYGTAMVHVAGSLVGGLAVVEGVYLLLRGRGKAERFVQTMTALAAVYLLFGIATDLLSLLLPIKELREQLLAKPPHVPVVTGGQALVALVVTLLGIWQLCAWIGIMRHALEIRLAGAVLVILMLVFVNMIFTAVAATLIGAA